MYLLLHTISPCFIHDPVSQLPMEVLRGWRQWIIQHRGVWSVINFVEEEIC